MKVIESCYNSTTNINHIKVKFDDGTIINVSNDKSYSHDYLFKEAQHRYKLLKRREKLKKILNNI